MNPYNLPISVTDRFLDIKTRNNLAYYDIKTLEDLMDYPTNYLSKIRNVGKKSIREINECRDALLNNIDLFVQIAVDRGIIDASELVSDPNELVSASFIQSHRMGVDSGRHSDICWYLDEKGVFSVQDLLLWNDTNVYQYRKHFQLQVLELKRKVLLPVQQRIFDARNDGVDTEAKVLRGSFYQDMLSSLMLLDHIPVPRPNGLELETLTKHLQIETLYDAMKLKRPAFDLHVTAEAWELFKAYTKELKAYLNEGSWTTLKFFDRHTVLLDRIPPDKVRSGSGHAEQPASIAADTKAKRVIKYRFGTVEYEYNDQVPWTDTDQQMADGLAKCLLTCDHSAGVAEALWKRSTELSEHVERLNAAHATVGQKLKKAQDAAGGYVGAMELGQYSYADIIVEATNAANDAIQEQNKEATEVHALYSQLVDGRNRKLLQDEELEEEYGILDDLFQLGYEAGDVATDLMSFDRAIEQVRAILSVSNTSQSAHLDRVHEINRDFELLLAKIDGQQKVWEEYLSRLVLIEYIGKLRTGTSTLGFN
jgi:hypothetical protein